MYRGGTPEIREFFLNVDPNETGLKRPDWFRNLGRKLGLTQSRIRDLFYDEDCKSKDWEDILFNKVRENIRQNQINTAYLQNKITGELNEQSTFENSPHTHKACHGF